MTNYFSGHKNHPYHLSAGAVLINDKGEVCVHHYNKEEQGKEGRLRGYWTDEGIVDFYLLMRETLDPGESLEQAVYRGLMEEFGVTAEIKDYIGSLQTHWNHQGVSVEKTTAYFLCHFINQDLSKRIGDIESKTDLEWHKPEFLIPFMKEQGFRYNRNDIDESGILKRLNKKLSL